MEQDTPQQESKKDDQTQYLKRPILEETDIPNPIQGPIKDPNKVFHFMKDVHDSTVPKMWGIFLDAEGCSLGNEPLALGIDAEPENFDIENIFHFYYLFHAKGVTLVTNHIHNDATPSDADKELIRKTQSAKALLQRVSLVDYIIVAGDHYWSMANQDGTSCHCGHQHYIEGEL